MTPDEMTVIDHIQDAVKLGDGYSKDITTATYCLTMAIAKSLVKISESLETIAVYLSPEYKS